MNNHMTLHLTDVSDRSQVSNIFVFKNSKVIQSSTMYCTTYYVFGLMCSNNLSTSSKPRLILLDPSQLSICWRLLSYLYLIDRGVGLVI